MRYKITFTLLLLFIFSIITVLNAQNNIEDYEYGWGAVNVHSTYTNDIYSYSTANRIAYDTDNNIISLGEFANEADFSPEGTHPSVLDQTLNVDDPNYVDAYIKKTDADGNYLWHKKIDPHFPGHKETPSFNLVTDENNNIYISGLFQDTLTVDGLEIEKAGKNYYIMKVNANGDILWVKTYPYEDLYINSLAVDDNENLYIGGSIESQNVDLDPGPGEDLHSPQTSVDNYWSGASSCLLVKLDQYGNYVWGKTDFGQGHAGGPTVNAMTINNGNLFMFTRVSRADKVNAWNNGNNGGDKFSGPTDLNPADGVETIFQVGFSSCAIVKTDLDADFIFAKTFNLVNDSSFTSNYTPMDIEVDADGNIVTLSTIASSVLYRHALDCDPGVDTVAVTLDTNFIEGTYIIKLDADGDYVNNLIIPDDVGSGNIIVEKPSLVVNSHNDIIIGKTFRQETSSIGPFDIDLDPGPGEFLLNGYYNNTFIASYDGDLNFKWGGQFDNAGGNWFKDLAINKNNNQIAVATQIWADHNVDLNVFAGEDFREEPNVATVIAVYNSIITSVSELENNSVDIKIYPNPSNGEFKINTESAGNIKITDISGKIIYDGNIDKGVSLISIENKGIYLLIFSNSIQSYTKKIVIK